MKKKFTLGFVLFIMTIAALPAFYSCGSSVQLTGSWKNKDTIFKPYKSIFIIALTQNLQHRRIVENDLANYAQSSGIMAVSSMSVMPPTFTHDSAPNKDTMLMIARMTGADAILTVFLLDTKSETRYVSGSYNYTPNYGYYNPYGGYGFGGYYGYWGTQVYSTGYYSESKTYFLESNVFDALDEKLVWSGQSQAYNPSNITSFSYDYSHVIMRQLFYDKILQPK